MFVLVHLRGLRRIVAMLGVGFAILAKPVAAADLVLAPLSPQPEVASIESGLVPVFYYGEYKYVSQVDIAAKAGHGRQGGAIAQINAKGTGEVLDSHATEGVGMTIDGLIRFPSAGDWKLVVLSNDGVRIAIDGKVVLEDPDVHADRYSSPTTVTAPSAGWYKLGVSYFQRHGSWALQLSWKVPGTEDYVPVPADAFAHLKSKN
jgi:hypothetical protein